MTGTGTTSPAGFGMQSTVGSVSIVATSAFASKHGFAFGANALGSFGGNPQFWE